MSRRVLVLLIALAAAPVPLVIATSGTSAADPPLAVYGTDVVELSARGGELYAFNCAVCHGVTGGGLAEAKLAFPEDHRDCTRCHRPSNRTVQPLTQPFVDNDMFAIGDPPALRAVASADAGSVAVGRMGEVAAPKALLAYVAATMPRYDPGRLTLEEYTAITAHLLALNDRGDEVASLLSTPTVGD